jgi:hypothetical protein
MGTKRPDQSLKGEVASIKELQAMTTAQLRARTCGTCQITYRTEAARKQCARHHQTG